MLLQWVVLEPQGPGNLASVRFSCPVRVYSLRIFPTGARPFKLQEDIVAETEPSSLYLDVYFNAIPISTDGKPRPKPSNALVPTSIAYQGGQVEFKIDSDNAEFSTRLMIVRGNFQKLSLAIYGEIVSDEQSSPQSYVPKQVPQISYSTLPPALDPANNSNPTELAQSLLTLIPLEQRPSLSLIIRLMFCLKPSNEDWEEKEFPHLYTVLDQEVEDMNLEKAVEMTSRPVSDAVDEKVLLDFAAKLGDSVDEYNDDQAYFLAKLLSQCAPQHPLLVQSITENIDLVRMYTEPNLDRPTLLYLLDAAANLDVSRRLNDEQTLNAILHIRDNPSQEEGARRAANRLFNRIKGWEVLEDSLLNTQAAFGVAAHLIREIAAEENSFGIWLENMTSNHEVLDRLQETPPTQAISHPPVMWQDVQTVSHDDFIAFIRAAVGVAAAVAVYAWADSVPVEVCRERTLAVLRLWQNVHGYREIVNHFMLMRQMGYRLECMLPLDDDLPSQAGIDAEHILKILAQQPNSMLRPDFVKVMQNLQVPLNYITDNEVMEFKRASRIAKDGLYGAVSLLTRTPDELDPMERRLDIRVAISVVIDVLEKRFTGEKELLETVWDHGLNGLPVYLIQHLIKSSTELRTQFDLTVPHGRSQPEIAAEFLNCHDLLRLLTRLLPSYPPPTRDIALLAKAVADIFVCTDAADLIYTQESAVCAASHSVRQMCIDTLITLVVPATLDVQSSIGSKTVLKTLLTYAASPRGHDASHHMTQSFWLLDHVLPSALSSNWQSVPENGRRRWVREVIPAILSELQAFYGLQEVDNKLHLIRRFRDLDDGCTGVAEWLLRDEVKRLRKTVTFVQQTTSTDSLEQRMALWSVVSSGNVLSSLMQSASDTSQWAIRTLLREESMRLLYSTLSELLDVNIFFEAIGIVAVALSSHATEEDHLLRTSIMSTLLRATRCGKFDAFTSLLSLLSDSEESLFDEKAGQEFGEALERIALAIHDNRENLPSDFAKSVFGVLEKVTPMNRSSGVFVLLGLTNESFNALTQWLSDSLPIVQKTKMEAMKLRWSVTGHPRDSSSPPLYIPTTYTPSLSIENWETLLSPPLPIPSTPTRRSPLHSAEMLGMITVSPPNALLRSPEVKGLTKTYSNNDFRSLRQQSSARQNTSRLPSRHVDVCLLLTY
ncbi:uncharacterized protein FOMMEDRAFT_90409 [Fomitiporia mediterranea MF3/22]|uniref:uncharacterized protein n=1 Tax=Fomitiporia mediterranea (strain MF3/22) TaxID=694068 RepID=UPI000440995E|nr:uncharacterized protein FOMMEDRAFT_90409 [Fomitiporia mediterranea MF3/22]EJD01547.1 hypothetical protein FOMMEDRAFT_90409 [Fomitiporia mediterranea MF3/22]